MPLLDPFPDIVPFEEVAAILDAAAIRARGGPPCVLPMAGRHLAQALAAAGFHVVRTRADDMRLTH